MTKKDEKKESAADKKAAARANLQAVLAKKGLKINFSKLDKKSGGERDSE